MSLKERILREMTVDSLALKIYRKLPIELKTLENLDKIQTRLQDSEVKPEQ